jgi:hypothetical protein
MRVGAERSAGVAPFAWVSTSPLVDGVQVPVRKVPSESGPKLYYSMRHRTQLYLDEGQYRWLKRRAGEAGSIAAVVRALIDAERARGVGSTDPLLSYLVDEEPGKGREGTSVSTLDRDLYGS